jgi:hypothetical protein
MSTGEHPTVSDEVEGDSHTNTNTHALLNQLRDSQDRYDSKWEALVTTKAQSAAILAAIDQSNKRVDASISSLNNSLNKATQHLDEMERLEVAKTRCYVIGGAGLVVAVALAVAAFFRYSRTTAINLKPF